ncbi:hypothetical protein RGQ29_029494 [Quercus rubra]|uniref:Uncharacterized protein n=1 Tax=Quercus rubra TaxID=3512 RepID=A0AAN7IFT8_QUERU|nr:hypothetical protein RGQ29_029494 [Quercus rubra]KAK4570662.1 hypothetical protein RGQ29_029494 [Quercus rubra]
MEDYLLCMKTLRSQMNDVEDQTAKITVEEQMQLTTIHTLEIDLNSAKSETKQLKEDTEKMMKAKGQICSQILERQRKIVSLESDSSTLAQTLELIQQEKASLSSKLLEMRTYFTKVGEEIDAKFQEQQVKDRISEQTGETEGKSSIDGDLIMDNLMKQLLEQVKFKENDFEPELRTMDIKTLEEEHNALLLDKAGVIEYLQTLPSQIETLKGISHVITCACGKEYKVGVDCCV